MWKEVVYGFVSTGFVNLLATIGIDDGEIIRSGFIFAMCITFAVTCFIRIMLASAKAERYGEDASTDWVSLGWFSLGALVASGLTVWVKELWMLVKMLFTEKPSDMLKRDDLEVVVMNHFPFATYRYMMWCGKVICRPSKEKLISRFLSMIAGKTSCTHEHGHGIQAESEHGDNYIRYYLNYYWHWFKHCPWMYPSSACYYINRYEVEAYAQEEHPEYWKNYNRENLRGKYSIPNAKKKWKELGGTAQAWKVYVKSL